MNTLLIVVWGIATYFIFASFKRDMLIEVADENEALKEYIAMLCKSSLQLKDCVIELEERIKKLENR